MTKLRYVAVVLCAVLLTAAATHFQFGDWAVLQGWAIGTPDAYGNVIMNLTIHQWNTTHWVEILFWDNDTNWAVRVEPDLAINLTFWLRLNNTLAASVNQAVDYTQVLTNITNGGAQWTNEEFNNTASASAGSYYYYQEQGFWNMSGVPAAGTDYTVVSDYNAFY